MADTPANPTTSPDASNPANPLPQVPASLAKHPVLGAAVTVILAVCSTIGGVYAVQPDVVDYSKQIEAMGDRLDKLETGLVLRHDRTADRLGRLEEDAKAARSYHQIRAQADSDLFQWQTRIINRVDRLEDKTK